MINKKMKNKKIQMNKRADIPIVILVVGVLVLCALAILNFYLSEKQQTKSMNSVYYPQEIYNLADSVRYSDSSLISNYGNVKLEGDKLIIEKDFFGDEEISIKIKYTLPQT